MMKIILLNMKEKLTFDYTFNYDLRVMKQFSNFLKMNKIEHRFYKKKQTLIIDDGFKTIFQIKDPGYWHAWRIDKSVEMAQLNFSFPVNSNKDLLIKCARYRLIPYSVMKKLILHD